MKNIKIKILEKAKELFNNKGVSNVSIREISREVGISHSNLIYHFKDKNALLNSLHEQILQHAIALNQEISNVTSTLKSLFISTTKGFDIIYDFRFFMIDFNFILRENEPLHNRIQEIEGLRFLMYQGKILKMMDENILREEEFTGEYDLLIKQIRIFSDYWLSSAQVYETDIKSSIRTYAKLLLMLFYPYLSVDGKRIFHELLKEFQL